METTYGPLGRNVLILRDYDKENPIITKDGVTVAKYITSNLRDINLGCKLIKQVSNTSNEYSGDGTTTSTILSSPIIK